MKEVDYAYLAGLIDGDGSIGIIRHSKEAKHGNHHPYIQVCGTNEPHIRSIKTDFGGVFYIRPASTTSSFHGTAKPMCCIRWEYRQAYKLAKQLLPYLRLKRENARIIVRWYEEGAAPSGANWRWHPEEVRRKQKTLHAAMGKLNSERGGKGRRNYDS